MALLDRGLSDPLEERGRDGTVLADALDLQQPAVGGPGFGLKLREVAEASGGTGERVYLGGRAVTVLRGELTRPTQPSSLTGRRGP